MAEEINITECASNIVAPEIIHDAIKRGFIKTLDIAPKIKEIPNFAELFAENVESKGYCDWKRLWEEDAEQFNLNLDTEVENYKAKYYSCFTTDGSNFREPKLNVSSFEGCPHFYGKIYWGGTIYEIQQKITEEFLEEGKKTGGDWTGYNIGEYTQRFLSRESLVKAFELLKNKMFKNDNI